MSTVLTDGQTSVDFYDTTMRFVRNSEGNSLGEPLTSPRTIALDVRYGSRTTTREQIFQDANAARRLLNKASDARLQGMGRLVTLTVLVDGLTTPVIYDVLGGRVPIPTLWDQLDLVNNKIAPVIELDVEPLGRSAEVPLINSAGTMYGINRGVTHFFVRHTGGTVYGVNAVGRVEGSLWQANQLTVSPDIKAVTNGDTLIWMNTEGNIAWDRIIFGNKIAKTGAWSGVWEFTNNAAGWTAFTPTSTFRSGAVGTEFDTAADLGEVSWAGQTLTNWTAQTINGVTGLGIRYRVTAVTAGTNLITNPSFESDLAGYSELASVITRANSTETAAQSGAWSGKVTTVDINESGILYDANTPVTAGLQYTFTAYNKLAVAGSKAMRLRVRWYNAGGTLVQDDNATFTLNTTTPARATFTGTAPATATRANMRVVTQVVGQGVFTFYTDAWQIEQAAAASAYNEPVQAPVMMNGGFRSHYGVGYIPANSVKGDVPADALIHYTNASGGNIAGVRTAVAAGLLSDYMPPFIVELENADLYAPTGGDATVVVATPPTPAAASGGADVAITVGTAVSGAADKAQHLSGGQYIGATVVANDKIGALGAKSFIIEMIFTLDTATGVPQDPTPLVSQWTNVSANKVFWCGIDQGRLRFLVKDTSGRTYACNGGTDLQAGIPYLATFEFNSGSRYIRIFLNAVEDGMKHVKRKSIRSGQTIELRVGVSVGFDTTDAKDENSAEAPFAGSISFLWIIGTRIKDAWGGSSQYRETWPGKQEHIAGDITASAIQLLWNMNDYAASATITDSGNGTLKNGTRTTAPVNTNDAANAKLGYYSAGVQIPALGIRLPQCYSDENAGSYRVMMAASPPASGFTDLASLEMSLQFNGGDATLPMNTPIRSFPDVANVRANDRYYLIDFGVVTFPVGGLWDGHRAADTSRNFSRCYLFVKSVLPPGTVFWVDCLYFFPTDRFYGQYDCFRSKIDTTLVIANGAGVEFDGRGPELVVGQTFGGGNNQQNQRQNSFAKWEAGNPRLYPQRPSWIFAVPTYPDDLTSDTPTRIGTAALTPRVSAIPLWEAAASA